MNNLNALVVDDSKTSRRSLKAAMEKLYVHVDCVVSGDQALAFLQQRYPDLILIDRQMPGLCGLDTVRAIKSDSRTSGIYTVVISGDDSDDHRRQALAAGADSTLVKPAFTADLRQLTESLMRRKYGFADKQEIEEHCQRLLAEQKTVRQPLPQALQTTQREQHKIRQQLEQLQQREAVEPEHLEQTLQQLQQDVNHNNLQLRRDIKQILQRLQGKINKQLKQQQRQLQYQHRQQQLLENTLSEQRHSEASLLNKQLLALAICSAISISLAVTALWLTL